MFLCACVCVCERERERERGQLLLSATVPGTPRGEIR